MTKLPYICGARKPGENEPIAIRYGERGYYPWPGHIPPEVYNKAHGITDAQVEAMLVGSMFGWDVPGANPDVYRRD